MACCDPRGCDQLFTGGFAGRAARRYRRKGLDATSRRMVAFLERLGLEGATVLEIGGGVGQLHIELLKAGAASAVNLELSAAYEDEATKLLQESGLAGRVERRLHDVAALPAAVPPAAFVVLNRVVCCYPDHERLLRAAAEHARRALVFSYPPRNLASRAIVAIENSFFRLQRLQFRTFAHPPQAMLGLLDQLGWHRTYEHHGLIWQIAGCQPR